MGALPIHRLTESAPAAGLGGTQWRRGSRGQGFWRHPRNGGRCPGRRGSAALADHTAALQWQHTRAICHRNRPSARRQLHGGQPLGRSSTEWTGNGDAAPLRIPGRAVLTTCCCCPPQVFVAVSKDGVSSAAVGSVSGILTPNTVAPTFVSIVGRGATVDEVDGTFGLRLEVSLDRPGQVYYSLYRWALLALHSGYCRCVLLALHVGGWFWAAVVTTPANAACQCPAPRGKEPAALEAVILTVRAPACSYSRIATLQAPWCGSPCLSHNAHVFAFASCRNYSCSADNPAVQNIMAGEAIPAPTCACQDASYCDSVAAGSFAAWAPVRL